MLIKSGAGGDGRVAWLRSQGNSKGGPAGGNGGNGGDVYVIGDTNRHDLMDIDFKHNYSAIAGNKGGLNLRSGRKGQDTIVRLPFGTVITNSETEELILDLDLSVDEPVLICKGGKGGLGNNEFKSSINRYPDMCTLGEKEVELRVNVELKSIADVGLVGMPSAGKSSLLNSIGGANAKVGAYPFTTLTPNLCVLKKENDRIIIADIPGLIEGSHNNRGLGFAFLRHIERCGYLIIVLDGSKHSTVSIKDAYDVLIHEMSKYSDKLLPRISAVVVNKLDEFDEELSEEYLRNMFNTHIIITSTITDSGIDDLKDFIISLSGD